MNYISSKQIEAFLKASVSASTTHPAFDLCMPGI